MRLWNVVAAVSWAVLTFFLMTVRVEDGQQNVVFNLPFIDKLVHMFLFGMQYIICMSSFDRTIRSQYRKPTLLGVLIFSIGCESLQIFLNARSFDILDIIANIMGLLIAYFIYH